MKPRHKLSTPQLAAIGAGALVVLLFVSFAISAGVLRERDTGIILPDGTENAPVVSAGSQWLTAQSVADVEIGTDNALKVIASLKRPTEYSCKIENTLYYSGKSSVLTCRQYVRGGVVRTDSVNAAGTVQNSLLRRGDVIYAWNAGETAAYEGKTGSFTDDTAAMLPTYEDVLCDGIVLTEAGRQDVDFEPCIRVTFEQEGYRCIYYISAVTGLLKTASFYSGDVLARQVTVRELENEAPDEAQFVLPDGRSVLGEE